jgi:hypothetical protein
MPEESPDKEKDRVRRGCGAPGLWGPGAARYARNWPSAARDARNWPGAARYARNWPGAARYARSATGTSVKLVIRPSSPTRSVISEPDSARTRSVPNCSTLKDAIAVP